MTTDIINWRELKRELFASPPRSRTSKTFQHNDIFSSQKDTPQKETIVKSGRDQNFLTPKKIRENDNTRSHVLYNSDVKKEQPTYPIGKKVFDSKSTIFRDLPIKKMHTNPHKLVDHKSDCFYPHEAQPLIKLSESRLDRERSKPFEPYSINNIGNPLPRSGSEHHINEDISSRAYDQDLSPKQRRLLHNKSNVFDQKRESSSKIQATSMNHSNLDGIKRINHNFSDVFGLEYGARESLQEKKQQVRLLSPTLKWSKVDSILSQKDIGSQNRAAPSLNKSRSRVMDQKSVLDTHNQYDLMQPRTKKEVVVKATMLRTNLKQKKSNQRK